MSAEALSGPLFQDRSSRPLWFHNSATLRVGRQSATGSADTVVAPNRKRIVIHYTIPVSLKDADSQLSAPIVFPLTANKVRGLHLKLLYNFYLSNLFITKFFDIDNKYLPLALDSWDRLQRTPATQVCIQCYSN